MRHFVSNLCLCVVRCVSAYSFTCKFFVLSLFRKFPDGERKLILTETAWDGLSASKILRKLLTFHLFSEMINSFRMCSLGDFLAVSSDGNLSTK